MDDLNVARKTLYSQSTLWQRVVMTKIRREVSPAIIRSRAMIGIRVAQKLHEEVSPPLCRATEDASRMHTGTPPQGENRPNDTNHVVRPCQCASSTEIRERMRCGTTQPNMDFPNTGLKSWHWIARIYPPTSLLFQRDLEAGFTQPRKYYLANITCICS